jgi:hypothetical protein
LKVIDEGLGAFDQTFAHGVKWADVEAGKRVGVTSDECESCERGAARC